MAQEYPEASDNDPEQITDRDDCIVPMNDEFTPKWKQREY
jgi:hypothetical protein